MALLSGNSNRTNRPQFAPAEFQVEYQEKFVFRNSGQVLKQAAQGGVGIAAPGGL